MTAAHCVNIFTRNAHAISVQVGRKTISKLVDPSVYVAEEIIPHPEYSAQNDWINDIAVIKLRQPLVFSQTVQPVSLPPVCYEVSGPDKTVTVLGWGVTEHGRLADILQKLNYSFVPFPDCFQQLRRSIYRTQICAARPNYNKAECDGDSGGPLMYHGMQIGIVSWSVKPCAVAQYPGVFTQVSYYIKFLYTYTDLEPADVEFRPCGVK
ncbi:kallikrein-11-like [Sabethes cyaneus]|uniref:kallikrein-11-like n=1 Tax=Sabethes cyaneus TaxID=53552 RepID=UPI00237D5D9D|nr:kallikrein-11-like [Sabethes cyaneus]